MIQFLNYPPLQDLTKKLSAEVVDRYSFRSNNNIRDVNQKLEFFIGDTPIYTITKDYDDRYSLMHHNTVEIENADSQEILVWFRRRYTDFNEFLNVTTNYAGKLEAYASNSQSTVWYTQDGCNEPSMYIMCNHDFEYWISRYFLFGRSLVSGISYTKRNVYQDGNHIDKQYADEMGLLICNMMRWH